jgi:hypothetical protein
MKLSEAQAKELGMVRDSSGNWVAKRTTELAESKAFGSHPHREGAKRVRNAPTHAESLKTIREACIATGMSAAEADQFLSIGSRS